MNQAKLEFIGKKKITIYGLRTMWRWKLTASNGKVLCASSEGFYNKKDCKDNADKTAFWLSDLLKNSNQ
jgi:hypothetical protein